MKQTALFLCLFFMFMTEGVAAGAGRKPLPPVSISIASVQGDVAQSTVRPGELVDLLVIARSMVETPEMKISIQLTGGAELVAGEKSWSGPVEKHGEKSLKITVRAPVKGLGAIKARVSLSHESQSFAAQTRFTLGREAEKKTAPAPTIKKDSRGRDIIESN